MALGERHAGPFLSSGVSVLPGAIAATTSRVRVQTGVSVLSIHDPLRVAEDHATVDQLSRGRLELVVGKGDHGRSARGRPGLGCRGSNLDTGPSSAG